MKAGILALQGDFHAHGKMLSRLGVSWRTVATCEAMDGIQGLIIPGGESTTLLKLLSLDPALKEKIRDLAGQGCAIYGTCAGAILLARSVLNPEQESLGLLKIQIARNGYGRQNESFVVRSEDGGVEGLDPPSELVFIRAPVIKEVSPEVRVLVKVKGRPVYVQQDNIMATTFHPELTNDPSVHRHFVEMMKAACPTIKQH